MKKCLVIIIAIALTAAVSGTVFATPSSVILDANGDAGLDYLSGASYLFSPGQYRISVRDDDASWNGFYGLGGYWRWNANIYWEDSGNNWDVALGDSTLYTSKKSANDAHQNDIVTINIPVDTPVWFYVKDGSNADNLGRITMDIAVVPEPVSSALFIAGGVVLAGRRYFKRKV